MKKIIYGFLIITLIYVISGCNNKKEPVAEIPPETLKTLEGTEPPSQGAHQPSQDTQSANTEKPQKPQKDAQENKKHEYTLIVSDEVKKSWSGVRLEIADKKEKKMSEIDINLGGQYKIPETNINITVNQFLPDFRIDSITITSASNKLNNPAVNLLVSEGGFELFSGWIFSKFPTAHPFNHERYAISLVNGIKNGVKKK